MKKLINSVTCKAILFTLWALTSCWAGNAQKLDISGYKAKYAGESKICLNHKNEILIDLDNDQLHVKMKEHEESLCLDKNAMLQAEESVFCSGSYQLESLKAQTIIPGGFGNKVIRIKKFDTVDYHSPSVFYDDKKSIQFSFPMLDEGVRTLLDYTYNITEPRLLGAFYFDNGISTEEAELTVTFPKNVKIGFRMFNCDSLHVEFSEKRSGDKVTYSWKAKNIPKLNYEKQAPPHSYYAAHMFAYIKEYTLNGLDVKVLSDINDLFSWYQRLIEPVNKSHSAILKAFTDSLTGNTTDEFEKVKRICFWVQDHIKYIAFEAGRDGYVPREAELVFNRRYGDCKDMASLIHKMLEEAGIKSYMTWIGTRHLPYNYEDIPLPNVDNHMIVTYIKGDHCYFLDGTTGPYPITIPPYWIQGKEALFGDEKGSYKIVRVPEIVPETNETIDSVQMKLDGKKLVGSSTSYFKGYSRADMYDYLANKDKTAQTTFLTNYFEKGNNKFLIDNFELKNFDKRDEDLIISYNFNVNDYAQISDNEIFVNLNMEKIELGEAIKNTRKVPLERDFKKKITNSVVLDIPKGYQLSYIPNNSEYKNEFFGFSVTYKSDMGHVTLTHQLYLNYLQLQPSSFKKWNDMLNALKNTYKSSIILKKTSNN